MASADFRFDIRTPREARSQWHQIGSPQVRHTSFLPVHRIYVSDSCMSIGHWVFWPPHPSEPPHIRFLFVEHAFCYRLPPDLVLPLRHCRVANPSPHRAGSGFSPYRSAPCWAHTRNGMPWLSPAPAALWLIHPDWAFTANSPSLGLPTVESSTTVRLPT